MLSRNMNFPIAEWNILKRGVWKEDTIKTISLYHDNTFYTICYSIIGEHVVHIASGKSMKGTKQKRSMRRVAKCKFLHRENTEFCFCQLFTQRYQRDPWHSATLWQCEVKTMKIKVKYCNAMSSTVRSVAYSEAV